MLKTRADEDIALGEIASSLGFLLRLAQVKVFDSFFEALSEQGIKPGEFTMLWVLAQNPGVRQGVIARKLRIKPAHMTKLVQRAVDAGHIERTIPGDDRRSVRLRLTAEGERFVNDSKPSVLDQFAREKSLLDDRDHDMLITLLQKLSGMENQR